mgnify:CR=1 FL=1
MKSRADGLASWCKPCSNQSRKLHRKSERRPEYRVVANLVKQGVKPHLCPHCGKDNVPAYLMRGRVEDGVVIWQCQRCHLTSLKKQRQCKLTESAAETLRPSRQKRRAVDHCDWCCDPFPRGTGLATSERFGPFCSTSCQESCHQQARARAVAEWRQAQPQSEQEPPQPRSSHEQPPQSSSSESSVTRTLVGNPSSSSSSTSTSIISSSAPSGAGMS